MKKLLIASISLLLFAGCGVGSYHISGGKADECYISFTTAKAMPVTVDIDGQKYNVQSVKDKAWKTDRKIKQTALNTIKMTPGKHVVKVYSGDKEIYSNNLFVSTSEHRVIEL